MVVQQKLSLLPLQAIHHFMLINCDNEQREVFGLRSSSLCCAQLPVLYKRCKQTAGQKTQIHGTTQNAMVTEW